MPQIKEFFDQLPPVNEVLNNDIVKGVAIGAGVVALAGLALPAAARAARPMARSTVKAAILFSEKSREILAEAAENLEDIVAEVKAELAAGAAAGAAAAEAAAEAKGAEAAD
ncbi:MULTISPECIES: DUF5132 domain-containing protein [Methylococcus]|uniref:DUF5132 domain-containing protein n=1 Tax=Methylococcus capsulatus TaxID=414 RepID=A0ABZ2F3V4_METCP|nr:MULTISPECIES: DUF5132 domain-containing protein [Methylococcus]MDF9392848.1 DUF5132 domain-containing protein [Methylococcus capsulatus]